MSEENLLMSAKPFFILSTALAAVIGWYFLTLPAAYTTKRKEEIKQVEATKSSSSTSRNVEIKEKTRELIISKEKKAEEDSPPPQLDLTLEDDSSAEDSTSVPNLAPIPASDESESTNCNRANKKGATTTQQENVSSPRSITPAVEAKEMKEDLKPVAAKTKEEETEPLAAALESEDITPIATVASEDDADKGKEKNADLLLVEEPVEKTVIESRAEEVNDILTEESEDLGPVAAAAIEAAQAKEEETELPPAEDILTTQSENLGPLAVAALEAAAAASKTDVEETPIVLYEDKFVTLTATEVILKNYHKRGDDNKKTISRDTIERVYLGPELGLNYFRKHKWGTTSFSGHTVFWAKCSDRATNNDKKNFVIAIKGEKIKDGFTANDPKIVQSILREYIVQK